MRARAILGGIILGTLFLAAATTSAALKVADLRCEYLQDPLGIDVDHPRLSWLLSSTRRAEKQTAYQVVVASSAEKLSADDGDRWDSGKVASSETAQIEYAGQRLLSRATCFCKVRVWDRDGNASDWSPAGRWEMGLIEPAAWAGQWIDAAPGKADGAPIPYLRKSFASDRPIRSARLYVTALGLYEMRLNGQRVGDHVFAPDWTDYGRRVRYQVYDVTSLLRAGENVIGGTVANGWYSGHLGNGANQFWGTRPALLCQLEITHDDGTVQQVISDTSWQRCNGPIVASDIMLGERYDAQAELPGWDRPGFDAKGWQAVEVRTAPEVPLQGQIAPPVKVLRELHPIKVTEAPKGRWIFDLGQNMVGVVRLHLPGRDGQTLRLRHGEMLNPDGTLYTANLRGANAIDSYVCRGNGPVDWQPRFTYHGFRYVELTGVDAPPEPETVTGVVLGSAISDVGEFSCSDARINQLQSNIQWGQRGNFFSVPTDCPQRNERLGWMGDAQVFIRTAAWNADIAAFFDKWMNDVDDAQAPDGRFSSYSPRTVPITPDFGAAPGWAEAGIICPWTIYQVYGDRRILQQHYPAMQRWMAWCEQHTTNFIREKDRGHDYGDWLAIGADTPKDLIGTAFYAHAADLMARIATALGRDDDAATYHTFFDNIRHAFVTRYVGADGLLKGDTQTDYAMALAFDLLPDDTRAAAADRLVGCIRAKQNHISTGFVGVSYLLPTLTRFGKTQAAYDLLTQESFPSWLFSVKNGATTIWERWDGWTLEKGFQNAGMNSFNHYSLGSCGQWLYETVGGIRLDPNQPAFRHVVLRPTPGGGIDWAQASYQSVRGRFVSKWWIKGGTFFLHVEIPANTTATLILPAEANAVLESNRPAAAAEGVQIVGTGAEPNGLEISSGIYDFSVPLPSR